MKPTRAIVPVESASGAVEVMAGDPEFDRARKLWEAVKSSSRKSHEDKEDFGRELLEIKTRKGFTVHGPTPRPKIEGDSSSPNDSDYSQPRTWAQWTRAEFGCTDDTANYYIAYFQAFQMLREALGEDFQALRGPFESLGSAEIKAIRGAVLSMAAGKHQRCLIKAFDIKEPKKLPRGLTGGDTSAFRAKTIFDEPTPAMASSLTVTAFSALDNACAQIARHRSRKDIEAWFSLLPLDSKADKGVRGLLEFQRDAAKLVAETISDLEDIQSRVSRFVAAKRSAEEAEAKIAAKAEAKAKATAKAEKAATRKPIAQATEKHSR